MGGGGVELYDNAQTKTPNPNQASCSCIVSTWAKTLLPYQSQTTGRILKVEPPILDSNTPMV